MIEQHTHPGIEALSAYGDGELGAVEVSRVEQHLSECGECRDRMRRLRELVGAAQALPRDIAPPPEVWSALRSRVGNGRHRSRGRWWHSGWMAAAAAIVLIVGTATLTSLASRGKATKAKAMQTHNASTSALLAVDRNYLGTLRELRATLETQRSELAPATIQTLERSIGVIDAAIAEARAALAADPANQAVAGILAAHYERQIDLLQRATALASPS